MQYYYFIYYYFQSNLLSNNFNNLYLICKVQNTLSYKMFNFIERKWEFHKLMTNLFSCIIHIN